jgi:hypothetical protein
LKKNKNIIKTLQKYAIAVKVLNNAIEFEKNHSKNDQTNIFLKNPLKVHQLFRIIIYPFLETLRSRRYNSNSKENRKH